MNIAILGGSFDPPHKGHVAIANRLLKLFNFQEFWLIPCFQNPFYKNSTSPFKRLEMTKYLEKERTKVLDLEIRKKSINYTIDTLRFLSKRRPKDKFYWVIGTDQVENFTKWKDWKEIINNFKLIIVPRTDFKKAENELKIISKQVAVPENIILIGKNKFPPIYVSSTLVRKQINGGKPITNMVPKKIQKYIIEHSLYK